MTTQDLEHQRRHLLGLPGLPDYDLDPFTEQSDEDGALLPRDARELRLFPLWDPHVNRSPFPDDVWAALAHEHNAEQLAMHRLYRLLSGD